MLWKRISVGDNERVLVFVRERFTALLGPGEHIVWTWFRRIRLERRLVAELVYSGEWADFLVKERPDLVERHFTVVETSDREVALVYLDRKLFRVTPPGSRVLYWKGPREVYAEVLDAGEPAEAPREKLSALTRLGAGSGVSFVSVEENRSGLLFLDNRFDRILQPGLYGFWTAVRKPRVEQIDLRRQTLEIGGQEILTRDKVSIRVNIVAEYRVTDAVKAATLVKSYSDLMYRGLQLAVRQTLGKRTLDEVLAEKVDVEPEAAAAVRREMEALGVEVGVIALKDVILPGEIRDILNQVVTAEKQAQANLIRRREETAATRSLLNTAKLMEDNPLLIRLKELETLERLTEKVGNVTVLGGFEGVLPRLLK